MPESLLGVNIDHIATLRNARGMAWPDPAQLAFIAEQAGADSITVHLCEDRRHITDRDVQLLRKTIQIRMNLEIAMTKEMVAIACTLYPHFCYLEPEKFQEIITERGLDVASQREKLCQILSRLSDAGIQVLLFIDVDEHQIKALADVGISYIEIHTSAYAAAVHETSHAAEFVRISQSVQYATMLGLKVNAGHSLDYYNVKPVAALDPMQELNIGHAIISRAVIVGLAKAVRDMKHLMREARS